MSSSTFCAVNLHFSITTCMIVYTPVATDRDIRQIIDLQQLNLPQNLSAEQKTSQGFVTVVHSFATLKKMNNAEPSIVAKDGEEVIGYLLAMTTLARHDIPVLVPMFQAFDEVLYDGRKISSFKYLVVGQVCIAAGYRGRGILDDCYGAYKKHFENTYDFAITEIHTANRRSISAHARIGFKLIHTYTDPHGDTWEIVIWDWRNKNYIPAKTL
jgi:hypothetical protein